MHKSTEPYNRLKQNLESENLSGLKEKNHEKDYSAVTYLSAHTRGYAGTAHPAEVTQSPPAQTAPDNTGRNVRDRSGETLTPGDQSESEADRTLTQRIRQAVVADDSLSTTAKNVKIITVNGVVTLRGPVNSTQEKANIDAKAQHIAGANKVDNQLEIIGH